MINVNKKDEDASHFNGRALPHSATAFALTGDILEPGGALARTSYTWSSSYVTSHALTHEDMLASGASMRAGIHTCSNALQHALMDARLMSVGVASAHSYILECDATGLDVLLLLN